MSKQDAKIESKTDTPSGSKARPIGLSISSLFYAVSGIYYLAYPIAASDTGIFPLYVLGALSLLGSFGVLKMTRWGLWLGLGLFGPQLVVATFTLLAVLSYPSGILTQPLSLAFVASLGVLIFFASLTFLLILDKRRSFK